MTSRRLAVVVNANDPLRLREFWVAAAGYEPFREVDGFCSAVPAPGTNGPKLIFQQVSEPPHDGPNRLHLDIHVEEEPDGEAGRLEALGARRLSGLIAEAGTSWIVLADPEGNEFCVVCDD